MDEAAYLTDRAPTGVPVNPALVVENPEAERWDEACDVLVVGLGLAGAAAALRAHEADGGEIIVADRGLGGGASELSGGIVYAGGTHVQAELGIEDSPDNLYRYLGHETGDLIKPSTLRRFADSSPGMITWLEKYGVVFGGPAAPKKTSYPKDGEYLYYSGNETVHECTQRAKPAPRGHRAKETFKSKAEFGGVFLMHALKESLRRSPGVRVMPQSAARRLILDRQGRVVGAELWRIPPGGLAARLHQSLYKMGWNSTLSVLRLAGPIWGLTTMVEAMAARPLRVRARRGVVLSAGGYINNRALVQRTAPKYRRVAPLGTIGDDGSGIQLGITAGGACGQMDVISAWRFINPPYHWIKGVIVSKNGERLTNEEQYGARISEAMFAQAGGEALLIVDSKIQAAALEDLKSGIYDFQRLPALAMTRRAVQAESIEALEKKLGMAANTLTAAVSAYNAAAQSGGPDPMGKSDAARAPLANGPFYALDISWNSKLNPIPGLTMGGLQVDQDTNAVLKADGSVVPGLYAAGRTAVGLCSNFYISGLSLADGIFSGWQAGEAAARGGKPAAKRAKAAAAAE